MLLHILKPHDRIKQSDKSECSRSIHMQNDAMKGKGYGTQAGRLAVKTAFDELGMSAVNADTIGKNTRSQYALEKVGFRFVGEDKASKYYRIEQYTPICRTDKGRTSIHLSVYRASIPCLSLWERWPSTARTERVNNDHTKRQHPIRKCPTASQGNDTPRT